MKNNHKKIYNLLLHSMLLLAGVIAIVISFVSCDKKPEHDNTDGGYFTYSLLDNNTYAVSVTNVETLPSEITIPEKYNGKAVTAVNCFADCENLIKVNLPTSITAIYDGAFKNCTKLSNVSVGDEVIKGCVFNEIYFDTNVNLTLGNSAFTNTAMPLMKMTVENSHDNDTQVVLTVTNKLPDITKINLSAALNSVSDMKATSTIELDASKVTESFELDFGTYGLFKKIDVNLFKNEEKYLSIENASGVAVTANEYNFAPLSASYPVLVFSLKNDEISKGGQIPTFVYLERVATYNWDQLPAGFNRLPYVTKAVATERSDFHGLRAGMAAYIKELYELNPQSKFNLYVGDNYGELVLQMLIANRIPETQWTATLLSDGRETAGILSKTFGVDDPQQKYDGMKTTWSQIKNYVRESGEFDLEKLSMMALGHVQEYSFLETYAYIMAKEEANINWIVNRLRAGENLVAINNKSPEFVNGIISTVQQVYTNNLLAALTTEQAENFKQLYKFNDDMFVSAVEQNKEVIMILGTSWSAENGNLYDNIKMLVELYGTENYVYYYKGHPGYPTAQYTGRQQYFEALSEEGYEINELDNAIAAEIILFFKPDIYMAGYFTSTFDSVESQDKALLLFASKSQSATKTYAKYFDVFASVITDVSVYQGVTLTEGHKSYLIEYNNTTEYLSQIENYHKHEIAIYDTVDKTIKYYKLNTETNIYEEVDVNGNVIIDN